MTDFATCVRDYALAVREKFRLSVDAQPEDQLKAPVGDFMRAVGSLTTLDVGWRSEVRADDVGGRPDLGITVGGLLSGHIELKRPGLGARPERFTGANGRQWKRFQALPNLIYTDGSEWSLYHSGKLITRTRFAGDVSEDGPAALDDDGGSKLDGLLRSFLYWEPIVPKTARGLAEFLAPLTRFLRDEVNKALGREGGPLNALASEWREVLFPEADDAQFADAYAQTVTYALLLAQFEGADSLRPAFAVDTLQRQHTLLAEALRWLEVQQVRDELEMPIEILERAIGAVDAARIGSAGDPWLYFYEQFLGAYDPKLRQDRGVYYTPVQVVGAQVRLAGELLRTELGKPLGFADPDVTVLDPAVGTGTYPLAVLEHAAETTRARWGVGAIQEKLEDLAKRLYAFEILVGPYSVAHLRISQRLHEAGVHDRAGLIYLTDTLESPNHPPAFQAGLLQASLTEERKQAQHVKKSVQVFVCLGNPPYDREERAPDEEGGRRKGGWVRHGEDHDGAPDPILEDFLRPVREAGDGGHLKNVYNDYVYFWRWALWKVLDSTDDAGIITFITASSYLRGPGFAGMRRKMREVFDELWIIDLEGGSLDTRKTENVFAITRPVAIAIGFRKGAPDAEHAARVWKTKITGTEQAKLDALDAIATFADVEWRECSRDWGAPFYPIGTGPYSNWPKVTDVFPWQHSGCQMKRTWPIGESRDVLMDRWRSLLDRAPRERATAFKQTDYRTISGQCASLFDAKRRDATIEMLDPQAVQPVIAQYAYRSFDRQWVIADSRVGDRMRPELWRVHGPKQTYLTLLLTEVVGEGPAAVGAAEIPDLHHFRGSFGGKHAIPLWRDAGATQANITGGLLEQLAEAHGRRAEAEDLFAYAYGVLAQPAYVERFWEELELPPPRLPITKDAELFTRVAEHGARLLYLHTYGERFGGTGGDGSVPQGQARCMEAVPSNSYPVGHTYDEEERVLRVGEGEFAPVAPEVYGYSVSGLQIVKSWLDYRKLKRAGRKSSPLDDIRPERWDFTEELLELLWVLEATIAMQPEGEDLLDAVLRSELFSDSELPTPTEDERKPPRNVRTAVVQGTLGVG